MSRMRTSSASFSWARPAMRRACSSGVRVSSSPLGIVRSVATVEAEPRNLPLHGFGYQLPNRLAAGDPVTDLTRGHGRRAQLERGHPVAEALEIRRRVTGTRADGQLHRAEHPLRILPPGERPALVGADDEDRV